MNRPLALCALACALPLHAQADLVVDGAGGPGFNTLAEAVAAANDGDRILIDADPVSVTDQDHGAVILNKAVTIESHPSGPMRTLRLFNGFQPFHVLFQSTSSLPTVFRRIRIENDAWDWCCGGNASSRLTINAAGDVVLHDVEFANDLPIPDGNNPTVLVSISTPSRAILRDVNIATPVAQSGFSWLNSMGTYAPLEVTADLAIIEDCYLSGSAWEVDDNDPWIGNNLAEGTPALTANVDRLIAIRSTFKDGNGSAQVWQDQVIGTSPATASTFGAHATFHDCTHTLGVDGGGVSAVGPTLELGPQSSNINVTGGQLGTWMTITVTQSTFPDPDPIGFIVGTDLLPLQTPLGDLIARPDLGYATPSGQGIVSFPVPNVLEIVGTVLVAQTVLSDGGLPHLGGASFGVVRR